MNVAIAHNNQGIVYLERGQHECALYEFKIAAQLMYSFAQELKTKRAESPTPLQQNQKQIESCQSFTECLSSGKPLVSDADATFICSTPIVMFCSEEPSSSCTIESAAILLNMGLCYHLNIHSGQYPVACVTKSAIDLYEMAYGLAAQVHEDSRSQRIIITCLNNLGQLYHEISEYESSKKFLNDLSSYVRYIGSRFTDDAVRDLRECMLNAMVLRNPNTHAAIA